MNNLELRKAIQEILYPYGVIPLEFGCEGLNKEKSDCVYSKVTMHSLGYVHTIDLIEDNGNFWEIGKCKIKNFKNLGKPSTLEDLMRALPQLELEFIDLLGKNLYISYEDHESIKYDLSKTPETQTQEVINQLIEILK